MLASATWCLHFAVCINKNEMWSQTRWSRDACQLLFSITGVICLFFLLFLGKSQCDLFFRWDVAVPHLENVLLCPHVNAP